MKIRHFRIIMACIWLALTSCEGRRMDEDASALLQDSTRIVSLNGTLTEMLCVFGFEKNIVGVDVTSTYPKSIQGLPRVGHNRNISSEGIISLNPGLVVGFKDELKPEVTAQLSAAGITLLFVEREYSVAGNEKLVRMMADTLGIKGKADSLVQQIQASLSKVVAFKNPPKVLFIYARGAGTLMVAGQNTSIDQVIKLAGGMNAAQGFEDYKPLTAESLATANPDAILMFSSGLQSLEGEQGLQAIPGIAQTSAGKNNAIISMDGQYLAGFGPRLGQAVLELNQKLHRFVSKAPMISANK